MAISASLQQSILGLTLGTFNMSAGGSYLTNFANYAANVQTTWNLTEDQTMQELARALVSSPAFQEQMAGKVTAADQATAVLTNFGLQGDAALLASTTAAIAAFPANNINGSMAALIWGYTKGLMTDAAVKAAYPTAAATLTNKLAVATAVSATNPISTTDVTALKATVASVTSDAATVQTAINGTTTGQTFMLTTGADNIVGTSGNDTINGDVAFNNATAAYDTPTLGAFDVINGGAGTDTLTITQQKTATAYTLPAATITNVENLVIKNDSGTVTADVQAIAGLQTVSVTNGTAADTDITTKSNVTSVTVTKATTTPTITDNGSAATTADTLASVTLVANGANAAISSDALNTLTLKNTGFGATITAGAATRALTVNLDGVTGGTVTDGEATSLAVKSSGTKTTGITLTAAKAAAVTVDSAVETTITDVNVNAAKTITVTGAGATTIAATTTVTALESVDATGSTGGVTITPALGAAVAFTGGSGKDSVSVTATNTKAIAMGEGDDTVTMTAAVGTGGSVDAGAGTDTLSMTAANAVIVSGNATFEAGVSNFEKLKIGAATAATQTINLANIDDINYVISAGGTTAVADVPEVQTITLGTLVNSQAYTLTVAGTAYTTAVSDIDTTAAELLALIQGHAGYAAAPFTVALNGGSTALVITFKANQGAITPLSTLTATGYTTATAVETTPGVTAVAATNFALTNMASGGTLELTGLQGASSVAVKDAATGAADVLNIKYNGTANIVNTATLTVANVETINITTTDSSADTTTLTNPAAATTALLAVADATKITVTGNHGVDFTGSTVTKVTTLDASGVVSVGNAAGATAAQIGTTGAVTFTSAVTDKAVTVTTGNGADTINVSSVNDATFIATGVTAATVTTGEGDDTITGSAGKDVINSGAGKDVITGGAKADTITTGAGNDRIVLAAATDSTLADMDVITDFTANTYGNGAAGAAGTGSAIASVANFTGDVIDLRAFITGGITKVSVAVVTNAADATVSLQNVGNATADTIAIALDSTTGKIYMDVNSDGTADSVMQLTGVTTLTNAAFLVA